MKSTLPILLSAAAAFGTFEPGGTSEPAPLVRSPSWAAGASTAFNTAELASLLTAERSVDADAAAQPGAFIARKNNGDGILAALGILLLILLLVGLAKANKDPEEQ